MLKEKLFLVCKRCGRRIKNKDFQKIGYGPSCYKKYLNSIDSGKPQNKKLIDNYDKKN